MTLEMELKEQRRLGEKIGEARGIEIGEARGIEIGENRGIELGENRGEEKMARLMELLMQESKTDDIQKALKDLEYRKKLFKEYNIEVKDS